MECRIIGAKYLILNNYNFIKIIKCDGNFNIVIEASSQNDVISLLDNPEYNNRLLNWNIINHFSDFDLIEEIISDFLANNTINRISEIKEESNLDYSFLVSSLKNRLLKVELEFSFNTSLRDYFKKSVILKIFSKYQQDCSQFLKEQNKKNYCFDGSDSIYNAHFYTSLISKSSISCFLEDDFQNQEVVIVKDSIADKIKLFEDRLELEQEKAFFEELDEREQIIKVTCNDCIFIFLTKKYLPFNDLGNAEQNIKEIVEKHNQSIEKGRELLWT